MFGNYFQKLKYSTLFFFKWFSLVSVIFFFTDIVLSREQEHKTIMFFRFLVLVCIKLQYVPSIWLLSFTCVWVFVFCWVCKIYIYINGECVNETKIWCTRDKVIKGHNQRTYELTPPKFKFELTFVVIISVYEF